jgi:hypothetical protein
MSNAHILKMMITTPTMRNTSLTSTVHVIKTEFCKRRHIMLFLEFLEDSHSSTGCCSAWKEREGAQKASDKGFIYFWVCGRARRRRFNMNGFIDSVYRSCVAR